MSMKSLSEKSGVSTGMISQIERDMVSPTIVSVHRLAQALDVNIGYFFQGEGSQYSLIRKGEHKIITMDDGRINYKLLTPDDGVLKMQFMEITLNPGETEASGGITHSGEESGYVLSGILSLELDGKIIELHPGDSIYFDSNIKHRYTNRHDEVCVSLWTMTPQFF